MNKNYNNLILADIGFSCRNVNTISFAEKARRVIIKSVNVILAPTNKCEIRVIGLQRSGMHAIINWIGLQYPGKRVYLLNDVEPKSNPFNKALETIPFNSKTPKNRLRAKIIRKDCLIYNYEDRFLEDITHEDYEKNRELWLGKSLKRFDLLILRDLFNLFASRLKRELAGMANRISALNDKELTIELWKEYAREYLGKTIFLKNNKIIINYNRWIQDRNYRQELAQALGIPFTDRGFNDVVSTGRGSSFDGIRYNGRASEMKVLERWKKFTENELYKSILKDNELVELSNIIFGKIGPVIS